MPETLAPPASDQRTRLYERRLALRHEDAGGDGRTLYGLAVPFDVELDVMDWWDEYTEVFRKGSFARTIHNRAHALPLLVSHDHRGVPVGAATELTEQDDGLHVAFQLFPAGIDMADWVLEAVKADVMTGLSIGFQPVKHTETKGPDRTPPSNRDLHERTEVRLREVSICNFPAYEDAGVAGIRTAVARHPANPSVSALAARRGQLHATVAELRAKSDRFGRVVRR